MIFKDRRQAGRKLARKLHKYKNGGDILVLGLPRGGVPVAFEIAKALNLPLSVVVALKIGAPNNPEFAIGAISEHGVSFYDEGVVVKLGVSQQVLRSLQRKQKEELKCRVSKFRPNKNLKEIIKNKSVILADDCLATGATATAAIKTIRKVGNGKIIFAVPVCASQSLAKIRRQTDGFVCLYEPENLQTVAAYYKDFEQISDKEVFRILQAYEKS